MARRTQVGDLAQPALRPTASPVDTFARTNAGQGLSQIADALGDLAPSLQRLAQQKIEEEKERGRADATTIYADIQATGQKIKSGEIAPHQSKWYQGAAREQVGRLMASAYGQDLQHTVETDAELSITTDPEAFDRREAKIRADWLEANVDPNDRAFSAGFNTTAADGIRNARSSFIAGVSRRLDGQVLDNTYEEHQVTIRKGLEAGQSVEQIAMTLRERNNAIYTLNPKLGKALNRTTTEAIFDAARAFENPELLKLGKQMQGGVPGSTLADTREFASKVDEVEREIRVNRQNRLAAEEKDEKRERRANVDAVFDTAIETLTADPFADVTALAQKVGEIDKAEAPKMFRFAKAFATAANVDDRVVANGLYERAFGDDLTFDDVLSAFEAKQITVDTAKDLRAQIRSNRPGANRTGKALIQDPTFRQYFGHLEGQFFNAMGTAVNAAREGSLMQLTREWVKYRQTPEGAAAKDEEIGDWLQLAVDRNFKRFATPDLRSDAKEGTASKPDRPTNAPPEIPDWETEAVSPWRPGQLEAYEKIWNDLIERRRSTLPAALEGIITTFQLKPADIPRFLETQRRLSPRK